MSKKPNFSRVCAATALALSSGAVLAQSSLTLYGTLDASVERSSTKQSTTVRATTGTPVAAASDRSTTGVTNGVMTQSYIGFKGVEDLGGGTEVSFVLETYLNVDTGSSPGTQTPANPQLNSPLSGPNSVYNIRDQGGFWGRNAYLGIKTDYGMIRLGQMDSLGYLSAQRFSPFGTSVLAPSRIFYQTDYYTQGWSNAIAYFAKVGNVAGGLMYGLKESNVSHPGNKWSATIGYYGDALSASLGYEDNKSSVGPAPAQNQSWFLNSSYDFGVAKIYAQYGFGELDRVSPLLGATPTPDVKSKGYQLGATIPVATNTKVMVSYSNGKQELSAAVLASLVGLEVRDLSIITIGATYDLSKRTDLYAVFSEEKSDYKAPNPILGILVFDTKQTTFAAGIRHRF